MRPAGLVYVLLKIKPNRTWCPQGRPAARISHPVYPAKRAASKRDRSGIHQIGARRYIRARMRLSKTEDELSSAAHRNLRIPSSWDQYGWAQHCVQRLLPP